MFLTIDEKVYNLDTVVLMEPCADGAVRLHFPHHIVDIVFPDTTAANPVDAGVMGMAIAGLGPGVMDGSEFEKAYRKSADAKRRASGKFVGYVK